MKAMVVLIILILLISILTLFWPENSTDSSTVETNLSQINNTSDHNVSLETDSNGVEDRTQQMTSAYEILEMKRKNLKKRLSRLKHDMWNVKFKPSDAEKINEIILNAVKLNKNPPMLGAFSGVDGINDEIAKFEFAHKSLDQVNDIILASKQNMQMEE